MPKVSILVAKASMVSPDETGPTLTGAKVPSFSMRAILVSLEPFGLSQIKSPGVSETLPTQLTVQTPSTGAETFMALELRAAGTEQPDSKTTLSTRGACKREQKVIIAKR